MIRMTGKRELPYGPHEIWKLLMDHRVLRRCMPGCQELMPLGPHRFRVRLRFGVGLVKGRLEGEVAVTEAQPPERYAIEIRAKGRTGKLHGTTLVHLNELGDGERTEVCYEGQVKLEGLIASVGARLFQGTAQSYADSFFDELQAVGQS